MSVKFAVASLLFLKKIFGVEPKLANEARLAKLSSQELTDLLARARVYAERLIASLTWRGIGGDAPLPDGDDAQTIVQSAFEKLISGAKWDEGKPLEMVLKGIIRSHISNKVRSWENRNFTVETGRQNSDEQYDQFDDLPDAVSLSPLEFLERTEDDARILELLEDFAPETPEYKVIFAIYEGACKRAHILEDTGLSDSVYEATKKRIQIHLKKKWQKNVSAKHKELGEKL